VVRDPAQLLSGYPAPDQGVEDPGAGCDPPAPDEPEVFDWHRLVAGLAQLSEPHREILQLKYFGELSYDEIVESLNIPKGTVMSRLHLARKALALCISEEDS
jgi:DNA-directed RNA polymerase specialized sigma24 family protein